MGDQLLLSEGQQPTHKTHSTLRDVFFLIEKNPLLKTRDVIMNVCQGMIQTWTQLVFCGGLVGFGFTLKCLFWLCDISIL